MLYELRVREFTSKMITSPTKVARLIFFKLVSFPVNLRADRYLVPSSTVVKGCPGLRSMGYLGQEFELVKNFVTYLDFSSWTDVSQTVISVYWNSLECFNSIAT